MKVIVCGAGQVGFNIARYLAIENNDVTVIDQSAELIGKVNDSLDVQAFVGHASHPDVLEQAGAADADMLIAVTYADARMQVVLVRIDADRQFSGILGRLINASTGAAGRRVDDIDAAVELALGQFRATARIVPGRRGGAGHVLDHDDLRIGVFRALAIGRAHV